LSVYLSRTKIDRVESKRDRNVLEKDADNTPFLNTSLGASLGAKFRFLWFLLHHCEKSNAKLEKEAQAAMQIYQTIQVQ
jgi:hypothetical protein